MTSNVRVYWQTLYFVADKYVFRNLSWYATIYCRKGSDMVGLAESERRKDEKMDGVLYDMSPAPGYRHGIINNNMVLVRK